MGKVKETFNPMSIATDDEVFAEATSRLKKVVREQKGRVFWSGRFLWDVIGGNLLSVMTENGEQIYANTLFTPPPTEAAVG